MKTTTVMAQTIKPAELLEHWQGHRRLTRKVIEAFPEKEFFTYTLGGMRPFAQMVIELLSIAAPGLREIANDTIGVYNEQLEHKNTKAHFLDLWDETTVQINELWEKLPEDKFAKTSQAFGQYEGTNISHIFYFIDNEVHHRAQAYVYLRSLGIEPPMFYDRA